MAKSSTSHYYLAFCVYILLLIPIFLIPRAGAHFVICQPSAPLPPLRLWKRERTNKRMEVYREVRIGAAVPCPETWRCLVEGDGRNSCNFCVEAEAVEIKNSIKTLTRWGLLAVRHEIKFAVQLGKVLRRTPASDWWQIRLALPVWCKRAVDGLI